MRWLVGLAALPFILLALAVLLVYLPPVQQVLRTRAVDFLEDRIGTPVGLEHLALRFPLGLQLEGLMIRDQSGDTLLYAGEVKASLGLTALLRKQLLLDPVVLRDVRARMHQAPDSSFNFNYIIHAFASGTDTAAKAPADSTAGFEFTVGEVQLERIHFDMELEPSGLSLDVRLGELALEFDRFALKPLTFHVDELALKHTRVDMRIRSGESSPPAYPDLRNPLAVLDVRFEEIALEEVSFTMKTTDTGDSLWVAVQQAELESRSMDLTRQQLALNEVMLDGIQFGILANARHEVLDTLARAEPLWLDQHDGFRYWIQDREIAVNHIRMTNSRFEMHTDRIAAPTQYFDTAHLVFAGIVLEAKDVAVSNEKLAMHVEQLLAHAGPDATAMELTLALDATPSMVAVRQGALKAMGNVIGFKAEARPGDPSTAYRAPYDVPIELEVISALRMADVLPLLRGFGVDLPAAAAADERWNTRLSFAGTPRRADRLDLQLSGDQGSMIRLKGSISNADRWPNNRFDVQLDELVMGTGMRQVIRAFAPPDITLPQRLTLRGTASGDAGNVRTGLSLDSDLGQVTGFANVHAWNGSIPDDLDLTLSASGTDVGRIIGDTALAPISFKLIAGGESLNSGARTGSLSLAPSVLTYGGNDFSSLRLDATASGDSVHVDLSAKAEPADFLMRADGRWPQAGDSLAMDLDLIVRKLQLKDLGITPHVLNTDGRVAGGIAFSPEGFGRVHLRADGLRLSNANRSFTFERFALHGLLNTDSTAVELDSDALTVAYHTNLGVDSVMPRAQAKLLSFFQEEGEYLVVPGRRMDLAITLPQTDWLTEIVLPELDAIDLQAFSGSYNSDADELKFAIDLPHLDYAGIDVHELAVGVDAVGNRLKGSVRVQRVERDSLFVENMSVEVASAADTLHATLRVVEDEKDEYLVGIALRREDGVPILHMDPSFTLNHRVWSAHPENALYLAKEGLRAEHFELSSSGERLSLRTGQQRNHIELGDFQLSTLAEFINTADSTELVSGTANGTISLPHVEEGRLVAELSFTALHMLGVRVGDLSLRATETQADRYRGEVTLTDPANHLQAKFDADLSQESPVIRGDADLAFTDLAFLKPFVSDYLFTLSGGLEGGVRYVQQDGSISVLGRTTFKDAAVGVIQTGAVYRLPNETVVFDERGMLLTNVAVLDSAGNRFRLDGRVLTSAGKTPGLDLRLRTNRFQLVNSTIEQNKMFFGDLFASIDLRIDGSAISPVVRGDVGVLDGTRLSIVLPGSKVELIEGDGIVEFTNGADADSLLLASDGQMLRDSLAAQLPGVELDLRIKLDKRAVFAVVIDPTTGDAASFSGDADLVFRYAPDGDLHLSGLFTVEQGGYTLEFYGLVKKRFDLVPGGTVRWDGDPLQGRMDIQARYRSMTAPFALVANARGGLAESERNRLQARLPFDVLINIQDRLSAPAIHFGLDLDRMSRNSFPQVSSRLDQLSQSANEEELNRQVFGLLVLNTFIQDDTGDGQPSTGLATSAARNSVNALLTNQLNRLTGQVVKGMSIQLGVNTYDQAAAGELYQRTSVDYKVSQRILNDRVTIEAGGSVGVDERGQNVSAVSNTRAAQYAIMYDLTADGRFRLRAFHENSFDLYDGEIFNNGVAIMLTREFEENARSRERRRAEIRKQQQATKSEELEP